jgi:hypothetical protein|tara:strand:- start:562 stop:945 length:384 start_codon:yes stop_codon:yes gene_type:complete
MTEEIQFPEPMPDYFDKILSENRNNDKNHLSKLVNDYVNFAKQSLSKNEFIDIESAEKLAETSHFLISQFDNFTEEQKTLAVASIYYFVETDDNEHDFDSMFGFEDDIEVMNRILEKLELTEKKIEI